MRGWRRRVSRGQANAQLNEVNLTKVLAKIILLCDVIDGVERSISRPLKCYEAYDTLHPLLSEIPS